MLKKTCFIFSLCVFLFSLGANAQDDKLQIHGYVTQGFLYSSNNNFLATKSKQGDFNWQDAVVTFNSAVTDKLRVGAQLRASQLGQTGAPPVTLDWASADYQYKDYLSFRAGKVKTPTGLLNETQDIDPAHIWVLLPQNLYSLTSRGLVLSHYGADLYGSFTKKPIGTISYKGYVGGIVMDPHDGLLLDLRSAGITFDSSQTGRTAGGDLRWKPVSGLTLGTSAFHASLTGTANIGPMKINTKPNIIQPYAQYEYKSVTISGEYERIPVNVYGAPIDIRNWYGAATAKASKKLTLGTYYLQSFNRKAAFGPARYSKDWTVSSRWDFNDFFYLKAEGHFVKGESENFYRITNPNGLKPDSKLLALKVGASF